ncbi:MAG: PadR family transcriptional regulator [Lachnospiraceae bacterium]
MAARNSFKSGSCELVVLHILKHYGDCYAYQISQYITRLSDGDLSFPEGSLYPAFYKMIDKKYISDYKKKTRRRLVKVYYHIEPEGEKRLEQLLENYYQVTKGIGKILHFDFSKLEEVQ